MVSGRSHLGMDKVTEQTVPDTFQHLLAGLGLHIQDEKDDSPAPRWTPSSPSLGKSSPTQRGRSQSDPDSQAREPLQCSAITKSSAIKESKVSRIYLT